MERKVRREGAVGFARSPSKVSKEISTRVVAEMNAIDVGYVLRALRLNIELGEEGKLKERGGRQIREIRRHQTETRGGPGERLTERTSCNAGSVGR